MGTRYVALGPLLSGEGSRAFLGLRIVDHEASPCALVWVPEALMGEPELIAQLRKDTDRAAALVHPNIVRVYGLVEVEEGMHARVVEYADAESMRRVLDIAGRLPTGLAAMAAVDACLGVQYAHLAGNEDGTPLVHGDLRPETLLINYKGVTKVSGYGALGVAPKEMGGKRVMGRRLHCAPEQVVGGREAATAQTDVYLLGLILYECLTGTVPWAEEKNFDKAVLTKKIPLINSEYVPPALRPVITKAMDKKGPSRFQTVQELREAIEEAIELPEYAEFAEFLEKTFQNEDARAARKRELDNGMQEWVIKRGYRVALPPPPPPLRRPRTAPPPAAPAEAAPATPAPAAAAAPAAGGLLPDLQPPPPPPAPWMASPTSSPPGPAPAAPVSVPVPAQPVAPAPPVVAAPGQAAGTPWLASPISSPPAAAPAAPVSVPVPAQPAAAAAPAPAAAKPARASKPRVEEPEPEDEKPAKRSVSPWAIAVPAFLLVGGGAYWMGQRSQPPPEPPKPVAAAGPDAAAEPVAEAAGPDASAEVAALVPPPRPGKPPKPGRPAPEPAADPTPPPLPTPSATAKAPAVLDIAVDPPVSVSVDGRPAGKTPLQVEVTPGAHRLVFSDPSQGIHVVKNVKAKPGANAISFSIGRGAVTIDCPAGAEVRVDGRVVGTTPLPGPVPVTEGNHRIQVSKGGASWQQAFSVGAGETMNFDVQINE